jgi:PPOX class probable FMN-dependent enzyme
MALSEDLLGKAETWQVNSVERMRVGVGELPEMAAAKVKPSLDEYSERFIVASPYVCVATTDGEGGCDASPRGDEPGFVKILGPNTLVIPERPGNRIADTLTNLLRNPAIGLLFLVPDCPEVLRVNGTARVQDGPPALLEAMAARGRIPKLAIVVNVTQAYMHCGRAATRSGIWDRTRQWINPRPDLLIGDFLGMAAADTQGLLDSYNCSEL